MFSSYNEDLIDVVLCVLKVWVKWIDADDSSAEKPC